MDKFEDVDLNATSNSKKIPILQNDSSLAASIASNSNNSEKKSHCINN